MEETKGGLVVETMLGRKEMVNWLLKPRRKEILNRLLIPWRKKW
jgi:hypothetical protein